MASNPQKHARVALGFVALIPLLAACTQDDSPQETSTPTTPATSISSQSTTTSALPETSTTESTATSGLAKDIQKVYEVFGTLAPEELFAEFETCDPSGVEDSYACSGSKVGQFQFFRNASKAASTTQLLTELRSSRVVEDTGSKVVGWTTIGTMSIITVVDNDKGLVLQQMVSSDKIDPEERIYELGLAEPKTTETSDPSATTEAGEATGATDTTEVTETTAAKS